jgi:hypothetical protein
VLTKVSSCPSQQLSNTRPMWHSQQPAATVQHMWWQGLHTAPHSADADPAPCWCATSPLSLFLLECSGCAAPGRCLPVISP